MDKQSRLDMAERDKVMQVAQNCVDVEPLTFTGGKHFVLTFSGAQEIFRQELQIVLQYLVQKHDMVTLIHMDDDDAKSSSNKVKTVVRPDDASIAFLRECMRICKDREVAVECRSVMKKVLAKTTASLIHFCNVDAKPPVDLLILGSYCFASDGKRNESVSVKCERSCRAPIMLLRDEVIVCLYSKMNSHASNRLVNPSPCHDGKLSEPAFFHSHILLPVDSRADMTEAAMAWIYAILRIPNRVTLLQTSSTPHASGDVVATMLSGKNTNGMEIALHSVQVGEGGAKEAIQQYCNKLANPPVSMIVVVSKGTGALGRVLTGSISDHMQHTCHCPVVTISKWSKKLQSNGNSLVPVSKLQSSSLSNSSSSAEQDLDNMSVKDTVRRNSKIALIRAQNLAFADNEVASPPESHLMSDEEAEGHESGLSESDDPDYHLNEEEDEFVDGLDENGQPAVRQIGSKNTKNTGGAGSNSGKQEVRASIMSAPIHLEPVTPAVSARGSRITTPAAASSSSSVSGPTVSSSSAAFASSSSFVDNLAAMDVALSSAGPTVAPISPTASSKGPEACIASPVSPTSHVTANPVSALRVQPPPAATGAAVHTAPHLGVSSPSLVQNLNLKRCEKVDKVIAKATAIAEKKEAKVDAKMKRTSKVLPLAPLTNASVPVPPSINSVSMDPVTGSVSQGGQGEMKVLSGVLMSMGRWRKRWDVRFLVVTDKFVYMFKRKHPDDDVFGEQRGRFDMKAVCVRDVSDATCFELMIPNRNIQLKCSTEDACNLWKKTLRELSHSARHPSRINPRQGNSSNPNSGGSSRSVGNASSAVAFASSSSAASSFRSAATSFSCLQSIHMLQPPLAEFSPASLLTLPHDPNVSATLIQAERTIALASGVKPGSAVFVAQFTNKSKLVMVVAQPGETLEISYDQLLATASAPVTSSGAGGGTMPLSSLGSDVQLVWASVPHTLNDQDIWTVIVIVVVPAITLLFIVLSFMVDYVDRKYLLILFSMLLSHLLSRGTWWVLAKRAEKGLALSLVLCKIGSSGDRFSSSNSLLGQRVEDGGGKEDQGDLTDDSLEYEDVGGEYGDGDDDWNGGRTSPSYQEGGEEFSPLNTAVPHQPQRPPSPQQQQLQPLPVTGGSISRRGSNKGSGLTGSAPPPAAEPLTARPLLSDGKHPARHNLRILTPSELTPTPDNGLVQETWGTWCNADWEPLKLRGATYLKDAKKVNAGEFAFLLANAKLSTVDSAVLNYSATPHSYVQRLRQHERAHKLPHEFVFVVNFLVPGTPNFQVCLSFIRNAKFPKVKNGPLAKFDALLDRFLLMSDSERDNCFKFIPRVEEGGWVVKNGVGTKPAIMGKKLTQNYAADLSAENNYFEVCIDVGSSKVAGSILGLVKGYAKSLVIDLCFLIEGQAEEELPEQLLAGVRFGNIALDKAQAGDAD